MNVSVELQGTPNFDLAFSKAIEMVKERLKEKDESGDLWQAKFSLVHVQVDDNYKRKEYIYEFKVAI